LTASTAASRASHVPSQPDGRVYLAKGFDFDGSTPADVREAIADRTFVLPAWADNQLHAANLDVRALEAYKGFFRLRVGSHRVVFQRLGRDVVVHRVGARADIYEGLDALRLVTSGEGLRVLARASAAPAPTVTERRPPIRRHASAPEVPNPLSSFEDAPLLELGLPAHVVKELRTLPAELEPDEVLLRSGVEARIVHFIAEVWERPGLYQSRLDGGLSLREQLEQLADEEAARRLDLSPSSLLSIEDAAAFARLLERPVEDWMLYLHPAQLRAVMFPPDGRVRVRGGAGTGKTVVALHRARRLVELGDRNVLLTTFVRTLPKVWKGLFATFAPEIQDRIDMRNVDRLSYGIYKDGGGRGEPIEDGQRRAIVQTLHGEYGRRLGGLGAAQLEEEIDTVLEGRAVSGLDEYLALPRTGRGSSLASDLRRAVWELYERYGKRLNREGLVGWNTLRWEAAAMLHEGRVDRSYDSVVVDEAQDVSEASIRLLIELAGGLPRPRLTTVGDGQQSIYPGGFSLRSLGVDVRGRSMVLRTNWRNTLCIWRAAQAFIADEAFDDLEDDEALKRDPEETPYPVRVGEPPRLHFCHGGEKGEAEAAALLVAEDVENGFAPGDCVVLHPINRGVAKIISALKTLGVETGDLKDYAGTHQQKVWVGTFHRAKGLEFKHAYVTGLASGRWPMLFRDLDEQSREEERARQVRAAFVALTRGRDTLDVICGGRLPESLEQARWLFDE
jgi:UvrD/REP helicase N-terminal domain/UvrD-like helicase C-terminal domain